ncbi:unnamed protein product [Rotaria socialis]|uniref:3CxxC-type domain-containing protein n=1 Tax=Rotaria socialis TaxID=392032 RepID=A0A818BPM6_9BILA|nr:unnamed protein product [Rotaria socialis]CAF3422350.1 unnamed protein product [Rotaria socialis]CAF4400148.1 unnamed protein product [Rotaria socialis]CAF4494874.1 unnamed protein product [Rotaria socialis]
MTGSVPQLTRQHSSAVDHSKMNKSYPPQFRRCLSTNDQDSIKLIFNDDQLKENLYSLLQKSSIDDDDDSGTEEIEQQHQLEHIFLEPCNDNENQLSIKSFGPNPDEGFSECETQDEIKVSFIKNDLKLARSIADSTKQSFCPDTRVAFHGEFARRISIPLSLCHRVRYFLFAQEELVNSSYINLIFDCVKLDNAKAQFQCPNIRCRHAWTSMRSRISFSVSSPKIGFIALEIFGQNCQHCNAHTQALWYIDEVCRVMKNLALFIFERYFPDMINTIELENNITPSRASRHDPTQRKGRMLAPHIKKHCEACRRGLCFV